MHHIIADNGTNPYCRLHCYSSHSATREAMRSKMHLVPQLTYCQ